MPGDIQSRGNLLGPVTLTIRDAASEPNSERLPKVSIVINNYNYERFVGAAIASALSQDYRNLEVVVVDDGSFDASWSVICRFADDPRVKAFRQTNAGQAAAMNAGFTSSDGDIVIFLDSDDTLKEGAVRAIVDGWEPGLSRIQFLLDTIEEDGTITGIHPFSQHAEFGDVHWQVAVGGIHRFMPTSGNAFAREALAPIFPISTTTWRICADTYLVVASTAFGRVKLLREVLGQYRVHDSNHWHGRTHGDDRRREIWTLTFKAWRDFLRFVAPDRDVGLGALPLRRTRDAARLHMYRRILTGCLAEPWGMPEPEIRRLWRDALVAAVTATIPLRHRILYLALFILIRPSRSHSDRRVRWTLHNSLRPARVRRLVETLKGPDFYDWVARRARPPVIVLPIDRTIRFGRQSDGETMFWYGFTRSDHWVSWAIGPEAALISRIPPGTGELHVTLEVLPRLTQLVKTQRLSIAANGIGVYSGNIKQRERITFIVPPSARKRGADLALTFKSPDYVTAHFLEPPHDDLRPLSFAIEWMHVSELKKRTDIDASPHVPFDRIIDLEERANATHLDEGWSAMPDGSVRMRERKAAIRATVIDAETARHAIGIEFRREDPAVLPRCDVEVAINGGPPHRINLTQRSRVDILAPHGKIRWDGLVKIWVKADSLVSGLARGITGNDEAVGPAIRSIIIRRVVPGGDRPMFQPGEVIDFRAGGNAGPYLADGWHPAETTGMRTADLVAAVEGYWLDRDEVAFLTATVFPPMPGGPLSEQQLKLVCNDVQLASYTVSSPAQVTAIIPAGTVGEDGLMRIEFRASSLLRPADIVESNDRRLLAIAVADLKIDSLRA